MDRMIREKYFIEIFNSMSDTLLTYCLYNHHHALVHYDTGIDKSSVRLSDKWVYSVTYFKSSNVFKFVKQPPVLFTNIPTEEHIFDSFIELYDDLCKHMNDIIKKG